MKARNYILATAGHVDHGKSTLVKALTGTDPDRLPEEKARGITVDLGFAHLRLADTEARETAVDLGLVDVPGHEDFVKNMVAGVGAVDLALLVVAADDGWMPQTEEHLQILGYLGVDRGVVALSKIDRVAPEREADVLAAVRDRLRGSALAEAPIVPTSVVSGRGLADLRGALLRELAGVPPVADRGRPRMWVDRAFTLPGIGTVVTGTLLGGTLAQGQPVAIGGRNVAARIRSIHRHHAAQPLAEPGTRAALNLAGVAPRTSHASAGGHVIGRGDLVTIAELAGAHDTVDVWLIRSDRAASDDPRTRTVPHTPRPAAAPLERGSPAPADDGLVPLSRGVARTRRGVLAGAGLRILHGAVAWLHVGTAAVRCRVILPGGGEIGVGGQGPAQLRLESALPLSCGDRFVLRDPAERGTVAGGVVLDACATRKRFRRDAQLAFLEAQRRMLSNPIGSLRAWLDRDGFGSRARLSECLPFSAPELARAMEELIAAGHAVSIAGWLARRATWDRVCATAGDLIAAHHRAHPAQNGLPLAQLRAELGPSLPSPVFDALVTELTASEHALAGAAIRRRDFRAALPERLEPAAARLRAVLSAAGLNPPNRRELAPDPARSEALEFLLKTGQVVALGPDVVLLAGSFQEATRAVKGFLAERGRATVSELRQALGISRRIAVPLLERLDRDGVTRRVGEYRELAGARTAEAGREQGVPA